MWFLIGQATNCDNEVGSSIFGGKLQLSIYGPWPTQSLINDQVLQKSNFCFSEGKINLLFGFDFNIVTLTYLATAQGVQLQNLVVDKSKIQMDQVVIIK